MYNYFKNNIYINNNISKKKKILFILIKFKNIKIYIP